MMKILRIALVMFIGMAISAYFCAFCSISWCFSTASKVIVTQRDVISEQRVVTPWSDPRQDVAKRLSLDDPGVGIRNVKSSPGVKRKIESLQASGNASANESQPGNVEKSDQFMKSYGQTGSHTFARGIDPSLIEFGRKIAQSRAKDSRRGKLQTEKYEKLMRNMLEDKSDSLHHHKFDEAIKRQVKIHQNVIKLVNEPTAMANHTTGYEQKEACQHSLEHFIMTKIEKTGSTTLFSVFTRYIWKHRLSVLSPIKGHHLDWANHRQGEDWVIGPYRNDKAEAMICHARYNQTAYDRHIVKDYRYIVAVRHPVNWILSAVPFFAASSKHTSVEEWYAEQTIWNDKLLFMSRSDETQVKSYFHLPQLQWLGLDYMKDRNNLTAIKEYIAGMIPKIDLPILTEQFDASLIVLRRRYCWNYTDILYTHHNVQLNKREQLSEAAVNKLLSERVNLGDLLLYEAVNDTWWRQEEVNQKDFWDEVQYFTELNSRISRFCYHGANWITTGELVAGTKWHRQFNVTAELCSFLTLHKDSLQRLAIRYAKGMYTEKQRRVQYSYLSARNCGLVVVALLIFLARMYGFFLKKVQSIVGMTREKLNF